LGAIGHASCAGIEVSSAPNDPGAHVAMRSRIRGGYVGQSTYKVDVWTNNSIVAHRYGYPIPVEFSG
jgi:hypothetical protein